MARKRQAVKIDDTQRNLTLRSSSGTSSVMAGSIPDLLMRANRRQYTQCRAYDFRLKVAATSSSVEHNYDIYTLSNAWWVKRAIEMAKGVYLEATKEERALLGDKKAKYHDFVISTNVGSTSLKANLWQYQPATDASGDVTPNEVAFDESIHETHLISKLKDDSGNFMGFSVDPEDTTGDGYFNIFDQYLLATSITPDADTRAGPYAELFSIDEDAMSDLQEKGDQTPWDADAFPSPWVLADTIVVDQGIPSGGPRFSQRITAPLGMFLIKKRDSAGVADDLTTSTKFLLQCAKGNYRGVHAPAYKAMKGPHQGLA